MKTYFLDTRTASSGFPLVLALDKALKRFPRDEHRHLVEIGKFKTRRQLRRAVLKRLRSMPDGG